MRLFPPFFLLVALLAVSGCTGTDDQACPPVNTLGRITEINGTLLRIQVLQSSAGYDIADVDTLGAELYVHAGTPDACREHEAAFATGQEIQFFVTSWDKTLPPQAHVDTVVVLG